jgi:TolB protein
MGRMGRFIGASLLPGSRLLRGLPGRHRGSRLARGTRTVMAVTLLATATLLPTTTGHASDPSAVPGLHLPGRLLFLNFTFDGKPSTLWTVLPGSAHATRLTHGKAWIFAPAFSPSGDQIVFDRERGGTFRDVLVFARPDGTHKHVLRAACAGDCVWFDETTWTPDGKTLLMLRGTASGSDLTGAIWSIGIDGSNLRQLTFPGVSTDTSGHDDHHPDVAPNGRRFVFSHNNDATKRQKIEIEPISGGSPSVIPIPHSLNPGDPTWTPDGSRILFQSPPEPTAGQAQNFYTIRPNGTGLRQITHYHAPPKSPGVWLFHPSFSPDGRYIAASIGPGADGGVGDIVILTASGHELLRIPTPLNENNVEWGRRS